jgi:hypothetical protein
VTATNNSPINDPAAPAAAKKRSRNSADKERIVPGVTDGLIGSLLETNLRRRVDDEVAARVVYSLGSPYASVGCSGPPGSPPSGVGERPASPNYSSVRFFAPRS